MCVCVCVCVRAYVCVCMCVCVCVCHCLGPEFQLVIFFSCNGQAIFHPVKKSIVCRSLHS